MANSQPSTKRIAIDKTNGRMVVIVAVASFITVFCLMASKTIFSTNLYQAKLTTKQEIALKQLKANLSAYDNLLSSYNDFIDQSTNVINGSKAGTGDNDGDNAKIILDALPYQYNFPAVASSVEKIVGDLGMKISSITGTDDQVNQQANISSPTPAAVPIPFTFSVNNADYASVSKLITKLQHSIRPIQIDQLTLSGSNNDMTLTINAHTYYQPAKTVNITQETLK